MDLRKQKVLPSVSFKCHRRLDIELPRFIQTKACPVPPGGFSARICLPSTCMNMAAKIYLIILHYMTLEDLHLLSHGEQYRGSLLAVINYRMRQGQGGVSMINIQSTEEIL